MDAVKDTGKEAKSATPAKDLLVIDGLTKRFGALTACDQIQIAIGEGEVHALLGENGAGKSTLVKMLYGALHPDEGRIVWNGAPIVVESPAQARAIGIGMVFQHFSLFEALSVAENIALALPRHNRGPNLGDKIRDVSRAYGLPLDPGVSIADLSVGERQRVEIVRCLLQEPKLIIMDEPTAVLTPQEADLLFVTLRRLAGEGVSILYITHRLTEVLELADRATILRHGKVVDSADPKAETAASLARMMVGAEVESLDHTPSTNAQGQAMLELSGLALPPDGPFGIELRDVDLKVRSGEVICIAGVAGNGQQELFDAISGERTIGSGHLAIAGTSAAALGINERRKLGAAFVPEERMGHGAVGVFRLSENVVLTRHGTGEDVVQMGLIRRARAREVEDRVGERFDVRRSSTDPRASSLSGGNLQKFVVGREIDRSPRFLVVNQPTWGVDAGAARTIRAALTELAEQGSGVLVISQDLDEIFEIADRIAVISEGRLSEAFPADSLTREKIGLLMGGVHHEHDGLANGGGHDPA